jgi:hypothetical protein
MNAKQARSPWRIEESGETSTSGDLSTVIIQWSRRGGIETKPRREEKKKEKKRMVVLGGGRR